MNKDIARDILPLVNDREFFDLLNDYAEHRIEVLKDTLSASPLNQVEKLQGAIKELQRIKTLRDEVLQILKDK